jgi:hypothetical protein
METRLELKRVTSCLYFLMFSIQNTLIHMKIGEGDEYNISMVDEDSTSRIEIISNLIKSI